MRTIPHFNVFFSQEPTDPGPPVSFQFLPKFKSLTDVYHLEALRVCPYVCVCQQMLPHAPPGQAPASTECYAAARARQTCRNRRLCRAVQGSWRK